MSKEKDNDKKNYLTPDSVNKISETFNSLTLYSKNWDSEEVKDKVFKIFNMEKKRLLSFCNKDLVLEFEKKLEKSFSDNKPEKWVEKVNESIDSYRRQADVGLTKAKRDMVLLWNKLSEGEQYDFDLPWMRHLNLGEKFTDFLNDDRRYIFTGFTNQAILGIAIENSEKKHDTIVISRQDLDKLLTHDFEIDYSSKTPIIPQREQFIANKLKGEKALTSIFVPKEKEYWVDDKGVKWKNTLTPNAKPTSWDKKVYNLERKVSVNFMSQPVWSVSSLKHLFAENVQNKIDELMSIRGVDSSHVDFDDIADLDEAVDLMINHQIKTHSLSVMKLQSEACYWPLKDKIAIPAKELYKSPLERYSAWTKELARSTRHLAGRKASNELGTIDVAKERLVIETTSFLLMKDFEEKLYKQRKDDFIFSWSDAFYDYFYKQTGKEKSLDGLSINNCFEKIMDERNSVSVFSEMMSGVLTSLQIAKTGKLHGDEITPYKRKSSLAKNFAAIDKKIERDENSDLTPHIIENNNTDIEAKELISLEKAIESLSLKNPNAININKYMSEAYEDIKLALNDLSGNVQDRLIELMGPIYDPYEESSPYDFDYNFYSKSALIILYNEIGEVSPKSEGKLSKLINHKAESDILPMMLSYKGNKPESVIEISEKKLNFIEHEISELRMEASYCDNEELKLAKFKEIEQKEDLLSSLDKQINATKQGLKKALEYLSSKEKSNEEDMENSI